MRNIKKLISNIIVKSLAPTYLGSSDSLHLTFDDGPSPTYTPELLDLLAEHNQKATFFLIGDQASKYPELVKKISEHGHSIGCHSKSHPNGNKVSFSFLFKDYLLGKKVLEEILGYRIGLFRPPYGYCNSKVLLSAKLLSMKVVLWNCDPKDWTVGVSKSEILSAAYPFLISGSIILLHDWVFDNPRAQDRSSTIESTEEILLEMERVGIRSTGL